MSMTVVVAGRLGFVYAGSAWVLQGRRLVQGCEKCEVTGKRCGGGLFDTS